MRLNKKAQYAFLFALYLSRSGRSTVETVSTNLSLSRTFLDQIARNLRIAGLVKSIRGPNGGFELEGNPTVLQVIQAVSPIRLADASLSAKEIEHRAYTTMCFFLSKSIKSVLNTPVKTVVEFVVTEEVNTLNRVTDSTVN